jgi:hypothetical protein
MMRFWLMLSRLCLSAWVGIASFFVVVLINLRGSPLFSDETKLAHPRVLFPWFYQFEFWLLGIALATGLLAHHRAIGRNGRRRLALALVAVGLLLGAVDYFAVYRPLLLMIEQPTRPPEFATYHEWSRWLNQANLLMCAVAAGMVQWPGGEGKRPDES